MTDREAATEWVAGYERAWRSPGTAALGDLFTETATYSDEGFRMRTEIVAVDGRVADER